MKLYKNIQELVQKIENLVQKYTNEHKPIDERFMEWLRPEGIKFFEDIYKKYGTVAAIWDEGGIPHPVHFREGMQIRNWMREQPEYEKYLNDDHFFDSNWVDFVEKSLDLK